MTGDHILNNNMKEEGALKRLWKFMTDRSGVPRITIIIPVLIYEIFSYVVSSASRNGAVLTIGGNQLPVTAFSGVFTALRRYVRRSLKV